MTPFLRPVRVAALVVGALALLAGCTAQPAAAPAAGTTARPAVVAGFVCPTPDDVAALTAVPFTAVDRAGATCTYSTADDAATAPTITVRHPAAGTVRGGGALAALRLAALRRGETTADAPRLAFDAFTATTKRGCTLWFPAADGVLTSVSARSASGVRACDLTTAVATLTGAASASSAAPVISVLADRRLLGTTTADAAWPWLLGRDAGVRIDRTVVDGYLPSTSSSSFTADAARVRADSAAVVFVSGTRELGASRLTVLRAATAAFSAAAGRAPKAELIVVGPVADAGSSPAEVAALRDDLQAAAAVAGARFIDPTAITPPAGGSAAVLEAVAQQVTPAVREAR